MQSSDSTTHAESNDLKGVLAGLKSSDQELDFRAQQQAAVLAFGRRTNAKPSLSVLMQDAVALVSEALRTDFSGVSEVVNGGKALAVVVGTLDERCVGVSPITHKYSLDPERSAAAHALNTGRPLVSPDLAEEQRFKDPFLRKLGILGVLCVPMHLDGLPFAALGVYTKQKRDFTPDDVQFAETIAHLLASAVTRMKVEERLLKQQAFTSTVLDVVQTLVVTLDAEGKLADMNRVCREVTKFSLESVRGRPIWEVFAVPEEVDLLRGILRRSKGVEAACEFDARLLTRDGGRRQVSWSLKTIRDKNEQISSFVLSGIDRTGQVESEVKLPEANKKVEFSGEELRTSPRRQFSYEQRIAPLTDGEIPDQDDFFEVECNDLSAGGISFVLDRPPDFTNLVAVLGKPPDEVRFSAEVVRTWTEQRDGKEQHIVGCRFTGRLSTAEG